MDVVRFDAQCINCIFQKFVGNLSKSVSEKQKLDYARQVLRIMADADDSVSAPEIVAAVTDLKNKTFGESDDFAELKVKFNALMLSKEPQISQKISASADRLKTAAKFAMLGNYIDFGAMNSVSEETLDGLLDGVDGVSLDNKEYANFLNDLKNAKSLVYLTDNCGEVVTDKLFIKELQKSFPKLKITVIMRGAPALNDATLEDASQVGLPLVATVLSNGTNIAGTCIEKLSDEARNTLLSADVVVSKGQGNFETLHDCGLNVYYLFLCKCSLFSERFNVPKLTGMFLNDRRMNG